MRYPTWTQAGLFLIVAAGLIIRLWGVNHVVWIDENKVTNPALTIARAESGFFSVSPQSYYPHFSHYLLALVYSIIEVEGQVTNEAAHTIARVVMALLNTGTIALTYAVGKKLAGNNGGLAAAGLLAVMPLHVKYSHFAQVDIVATFFMVAALLAALKVWEGAGRSWYLWTGFFIGAAGASQYWGFSIGIALLLAHGRHVLMAPGSRKQIWHLPFITGLLAIPLTFVLFSPYWIFDFKDNWDAFQTISARGAAGDLGHTRPSFLWPLYNQSQDWGLSFTSAGLIWETPVLTFALGVLGALYGIWRRDVKFIVMVVVVSMVLYAAISGGLRLYAIKRLMPLGPLIAVAAGYGLARVPWPKWLGVGLWLAALVAAAWPSVAFSLTYAGVSTHDQAVRWAQEHIPPGATVLQHTPLQLLPWDDKYRNVIRIDEVYANFTVDDPEVSHDRSRSLSQWVHEDGVDFVVMDSRIVDRYYDSTSRQLYPETTASYRQFYDTVRREGKRVYAIEPVLLKQAGARVEIYDVRGLR